MTRDEARAWYVTMLIDKIRKDPYPSATQMKMVEVALSQTPALIPEYMDVLLEKVADESYPSVPMLQRITGIAELLPSR
jgi:hypothetical protein